MSQAAYSPLKAAWHLDRIQQLRDGQQIAPVELQFILSDLCNQDCYFCAYRAETGLSAQDFVEWKGGVRNHNPNRMIPQQKAIDILEDAWNIGVKSIIFTGGGEPAVHPHHLEVFRCALNLGFDCSLNTNGLLLRKGWESVLSQFAYIRFSIDAASPEEYARIRHVAPSQYERVLANMQRVVEVCAPHGCVVGAGYVVNPQDYRTLVQGVRNIRSTGASYVRLASLQSTEQGAIYDGVLKDVHAYLVAAQQEETETFKVVNLFTTTLGQQAAGPFCGMQQFVLYIAANLRVYRCCYTAYAPIGEIGDLSKQSFAEWFFSVEKQKLIGEFDARICAVCPLEHKNVTMRYMIDPNPVHVNFV